MPRITFPPGVAYLSLLIIDANKDWQKKNITNLGAGAHDLNAKLSSIITALSQLAIDADKDWAGKNITNLGAKGYSLANQLIHGVSFNLGLAAVGTKLAQALIPGTFTISKVKIYADTAPTGSSLIVDVNKNGTTIFTTQANRPEIAIGGHSDDSGTPDITALAEGDRLSIDIDQVGSTIPGGDDLLVTVII